MTERITGVEGTKLDNEFQEMEKRTDLFNELVILKTYFEESIINDVKLVKILNPYIILLGTHMYHTSFRYLCNGWQV